MTRHTREVQNQGQLSSSLDCFGAADSHGEAHSSAMFKLRKRDGLHEPYLCHTAEDRGQLFTSAITEWQLKGNICKIRRTHASREKRAARHYKGAPAPLRGSIPHLPRMTRRLPEEKKWVICEPASPAARAQRAVTW